MEKEAMFLDSDTHSLMRELICGGGGSGVGIFIGVPFDLAKVRMQTFPGHYRNAWHCLQETIRNEGIRGVYKGTSAPVLAQGAISSLCFAGEHIGMKVLEPNLKPGELGKPHNVYLAGSFGGLLQCIVLVPTDAIKCNMQVDNLMNSKPGQQPRFRGILDCASQLGLRSMYSGFGATVLREIPSIGLYFFVYRYLKDKFTPAGASQPSSAATLLAGGIAGCSSWFVVYPFDVIKSNIQVAASNISADQHTSNNRRSKGIIDTARDLHRRHGWRVFSSGLGATLLRAFPVNAATFFFYEYFKTQLHL